MAAELSKADYAEIAAQVVLLQAISDRLWAEYSASYVGGCVGDAGRRDKAMKADAMVWALRWVLGEEGRPPMPS